MYQLFADLKPAPAVKQRRDSLEQGRATQGLVPDFKICLPTPEGLRDQHSLTLLGRWIPPRFRKRNKRVPRLSDF